MYRFNGLDFLKRWSGKKIMFVGDSLSLNEWQSLCCMVHEWVPNSRTKYVRTNLISSVTFEVSKVLCFPFSHCFILYCLLLEARNCQFLSFEKVLFFYFLFFCTSFCWFQYSFCYANVFLLLPKFTRWLPNLNERGKYTRMSWSNKIFSPCCTPMWFFHYLENSETSANRLLENETTTHFQNSSDWTWQGLQISSHEA